MENKNILLWAAIILSAAALILFASNTINPGTQPENKTPRNITASLEPDAEAKPFTSYQEIKEFISKSSAYGGSPYSLYSRGALMEKSSMDSIAPMAGIASISSEAPATDYSTTNIQVQGVDEADIVKNDGTYIYTISGNTLTIIEAYPPQNARIVSETKLKGQAREILINKDRLIVFGQSYGYEEPVKSQIIKDIIPSPIRYSESAYVEVYDISDRSSPKLKRNIAMEGTYQDSRMIGEYVYAVINTPIRYYTNEPILPLIKENGASKTMPPTNIYYFPVPDYNYNYINIISINTQNEGEQYKAKTYLAGNAQNIFVSRENIYLTYTWNSYIYNEHDLFRETVIPALPQSTGEKVKATLDSDTPNKWEEVQQQINLYLDSLSAEQVKELEAKIRENTDTYQERISREREKTTIHRIAANNGNIEYKGKGTVPGTVLNQFSMDEHNGNLRTATTNNPGWFRTGKQQPERNNIYVLNQDMAVIGRLEDLAPGERIYSARFIGERAYLVTFKKTDPLFVIDLKEPEKPKVLGKLKIPGYSDYLHPYDENHIIGIGKEAVEAEQGDFAWYQGVKLALFDVSEPENPKEISKYNIGDRGTDSEALRDHKAFLFSKEKKLLVIPILLAEINEKQYSDGKVPMHAYGDYTWQGAYVLSLDANEGFKLKGRITHLLDDSLIKAGYYYNSDSQIRRTLYMDNTLYTLSGTMLKMNDLDTIKEINSLKLSKTESFDQYYQGGGGTVVPTRGAAK